MRSPLMIASALSVLVIGVVAAFLALGGDGGDVVQSAPLQYTGDPIRCASGLASKSLYAAADGQFRLVGRLQAFQGNDFVVRGPRGPMVLVLAQDAKVEGTYLAGDPMDVRGQTGPSVLLAKEVLQVCPSTPTPAVTATPRPGTPAPTPAITPRPSKPAFAAPHHSAPNPAPAPKPRKPKH